jgi:hypothetical protein
LRGYFAANHELDDLIIVPRAPLESRYVPTIPEHRTDVGERFNLVHAMRNVQDWQLLLA